MTGIGILSNELKVRTIKKEKTRKISYRNGKTAITQEKSKRTIIQEQ
jgi:hypothetical protein